MEYLMILFLNNWPIEVERFKTLAECQEKVKTYNKAAIQSGSSYKVWCEKRQL
jgi:hypothetical protein